MGRRKRIENLLIIGVSVFFVSFPFVLGSWDLTFCAERFLVFKGLCSSSWRGCTSRSKRNNSPRERTSPKDKNCTSLFFSYSDVSGTSSTSPHINSLLIFILLIGALLKDLEMKRLSAACIRFILFSY